MLRILLVSMITLFSSGSLLAASKETKCCCHKVSSARHPDRNNIPSMLFTVNDSIRVLDQLQASLERATQEDILASSVQAMLGTLDDNFALLAKYPEGLSPLQKILKHNAIHHFGTTKAGTYVIYHGFDCAECGRGTRHSWGWRTWDPAACCLLWGTLFCAGAQCYLYQWLISPCLPESYECTHSPASVNRTDLLSWVQGRKQYLETLRDSLQAPSTGAPLPTAPHTSGDREDLESIGPQDPAMDRRSVG